MHVPLYEKIRPQSFKQIVGHDAWVGQDGALTSLINQQKPQSILLWGPPGCGKTTIAKAYAKAFDLPFQYLSCVSGSMEDIKKEVLGFQKNPLFQRQILLFLDELHRLNKAQQDFFLPFLEKGQLILVGATTENPSFHINAALLSRMRVVTLTSLQPRDLGKILDQVLAEYPLQNLDVAVKHQLIELSHGDARYLLNLVETIINANQSSFSLEDLERLLSRKLPVYDKDQDSHYHMISALHKAVRGSDADASLYWLSRMLIAGEDREFLLRRLTRMAVEDIGLADPQALTLAISAWDAFNKLGSPEGDLALAEVTIYLALSPKSNKVYAAFNKAKDLASKTSHLPVPSHIINAVNSFGSELGHGDGYIYEPDTKLGVSEQSFLPPEIKTASFYEPIERGFEREMKKRKDYFKNLKNSLKNKKPSP